jgi:hypothetical protein
MHHLIDRFRPLFACCWRAGTTEPC